MAVLFSYARQGMEGDRAGLNRPPATGRKSPETATLTGSPGPAPSLCIRMYLIPHSQIS
ncbi:hypothetical protein [Lelliottia amnigena]|uniref:hypothetical protein n=1 Tax=Lelliottia amnigena TaxID=61646 RepID=UPI001EF7CACA|nr:hypothetical protein [Lelliottia amnigena]MCG7783407.1 hypothetical protein [Lelliottia amnigena]